MKIKIIQRTDYNDYLQEEMEIDGKYSVSVYPLCECPEDAIIERDLVGCSDIADYMQKAYDAAKRGEELEIIVEKE